MSGLRRPPPTKIAVCVLIALVTFGCQRSLLYFPDTTAPEPGHPDVRVVRLLSEPGLELRHLYHPPGGPNGPVVVLFHGNAGHAGYRVRKFRDLLDAGFGVFFAEYRGYGGNPGQPDEAGLTADAGAVMAYLQSEGIDPARIVLYGESLGAGVAVKMAADHPVAGLVLEAPYTSIADVAQAHYWFLPARWLVPDEWNVAAHIAEVSTPVLVLHGEADRVIPVRFGKRVFALAAEPKVALFHPRAGHNDLLAYPEVVERVIAFVREQVPDTAADPAEAHVAADWVAQVVIAPRRPSGGCEVACEAPPELHVCECVRVSHRIGVSAIGAPSRPSAGFHAAPAASNTAFMQTRPRSSPRNTVDR